LTVFAIDDSGQRESLFATEGPAVLGGVAVLDRDVVIASYYFPWLDTGNQQARAEVARYHRDGELVWRQTGLRYSDVQLSPRELGIVVLPQLPLAVDGDDGLWLSVVEDADRGFADFNLVRLGPDGNVRWLTLPISVESFFNMRLAVSPAGSALLAQGSYPMWWFEQPSGSPPEVLRRQVMRLREDFWEPVVFAFDFDAEGRALIATQAGPRLEPRMLIDRISADFARRETFVVPELSDHVGDLDGIEDLSTVDGDVAVLYPFRGMRAVDGSVYLWGPEQLARVDLP
jgi:hypothetical protein